MSRIGNTPITIPEKVSIEIKGNEVIAKTDKGEQKTLIPPQISVEKKDSTLIVTRKNNSKSAKSLHGLTRALIANSIQGVQTGYEKVLELVGTGYRVKKQGSGIVLSLGFSHDIEYTQPEGIQIELEGNNKITIKGISKQKVGQAAAEIRSFKKPEPYKGKGIKYKGEIIRRKAGKAAKAAGGAVGE